MRFRLHQFRPLLVVFLAAAVGACTPEPAPEVDAHAPVLRRLTEAQFENSVRDLFGTDIVVPPTPEPDQRAVGLVSVGAGVAALSPRGVENFEAMAYNLAEQAMQPERRDLLVSCSPSGTADEACARSFLEEFGRAVWRRPLTSDELDQLQALVIDSANTLGDFYTGLEFGVAALLQAPEFVYRVELGNIAPSGEDARRFDDWELASRLSFFLWNTTPDTALLDAAAAGELVTHAGLTAQIDRMLASPRSRDGLRRWISDMLSLDELSELYKEPTVFQHMSDTLGASAREETLMGFEVLALDEEGDLRDLMTTRRTFINRELAAIYDVRAPERDGFGAMELPEDGPREGLLGHTSLLALHAHPVSTSATLRGQFVREVLLCQDLPGPPAGVDTSIPPVSEDARTLRQRVERHLSDPSCAGCHQLMDPVGLALENFDGIGRYRTMEEGVSIDPSGQLDGVTFDDAPGLGAAIREHPDFVPCMVKTLVRYANGAGEARGELGALDWLTEEFRRDDHRLTPLLYTFLTSPLFLQAGEVE